MQIDVLLLITIKVLLIVHHYAVVRKKKLSCNTARTNNCENIYFGIRQASCYLAK